MRDMTRQEQIEALQDLVGSRVRVEGSPFTAPDEVWEVTGVKPDGIRVDSRPRATLKTVRKSSATDAAEDERALGWTAPLENLIPVDDS